jgi:hypothetical protein
MPHKDRARRRARGAAYHAAHRPPSPAPQPDRGDLPPPGAMICDEDGGRAQRHTCGRFARSLSDHPRPHGPDAAPYKGRADLARAASPASRLPGEAAAVGAGRNQEGIGREALAESGPNSRPTRIPRQLRSRIRESTAEQGTRRR